MLGDFSADARHSSFVWRWIQVGAHSGDGRDDAGEEIDLLKAKIVKKGFTTMVIDGTTVTGLPIQTIDDEERLVAVSLSKYPYPVWIETMSIEIWPGNQLDCPEVTVGESDIEKSGMTTGFGEHCKRSENASAGD